MKKNQVLMALLFSAGILISACGSNEPKATETETQVAEQVINTTHAYICPMNCENSASNEPGQCKVCGMDLVKNPNYAGAVDSTSTATDTTATQGMQEDEKEEGHEGHNH